LLHHLQINNMTIKIGFVVIGRNEGHRLLDCLNSIGKLTSAIVYVDSASTDDSVQEALALNVHVVELDMSTKFTAARARNAGFERLIREHSDLSYVHFVDGDCIVNEAWVEYALTFLEHHPHVAVVCGRRRERYPEASPYNRLCDIEWNTPIGKAKACGGDAIMRVSVFQQVRGFNENLIAGEEPELCIRIRQLGHDVWRLDHDMTLHDAAIFKLSQWWKRTMRAGYAYAEGSHLHGAAPEYHWVKESRRAWIWGGLIPLVLLVLTVAQSYWALSVLLLLMVQYLRLVLQNQSKGKFSIAYAFFLMIGKVAEMCGQLKYLWHRSFNLKSVLIEYK
jgi:GT2 family glycosyltransferase